MVIRPHVQCFKTLNEKSCVFVELHKFSSTNKSDVI